MRSNTLILAVLVILTGSTAMAQINPVYKYLHPGSRMLMSFNLLKIAAKVPGETFRQSSLYQDMMKNDDGKIKAFLADPSSTGIDFTTDFVLSSGSADGENDAPVLIGRLADQSKFAGLMEKMNKSEEPRIQVFGNNRMILPKSFEPAIAWNDEVFIITGMGGGKKEMTDLFADTTDTRDMDQRMKEVKDRMQKRTREFIFEVLSPKSNNPLMNNTVFNALMLENGDIRIWNSGVNTSGNNTFKKLPPFITQLFSKMQAAAGSERTSIINFEKGKIAGTVRTHLSPDMSAIYQKYPQGSLPTGLVRRLPEGKILLLMMNALNKELTREISQKNGMADLIDSLKQYLKMDLGLFQRGFRNSGMLAIMELPAKEEGTEGKKNFLENLGFFVVLPVADKEAVATLKEMADRKMDSLTDTEKGGKILSAFRPSILFNDSICVVAHSAAMAEAYLQNPGTAELPSWLPANQPGTSWMNINFRELMSMVINMAGKPGKGKDKQVNELLSMFDQMIITGGDFSEGSLNSRMEFRFSNPDKNVMEQLFDMMNKITREKAQASQETFTPPVMVPDEAVAEAPKEAPPAKKKAPVKKQVAKPKGKN